MKIIAGLGNPGTEYSLTRHNAGIMLVDFIANQAEIYGIRSEYGWRRKKEIMVFESRDLMLVKTAGLFMNESGRIIDELRFMNIDLTEETKENILFIAHDDLDIKLGESKIQLGKGPKVHNGVLSVENALGYKDFWRIRIGVDNRQSPVEGEEYVLGKFNLTEREIINQVLERTANELFA